MSYENLLVEDREAIRVVTVNRPDKLNALNEKTISELQVAFDEARDAPSVRVVVLTGAGPKAFVAGADIAQMNGLTPVQGRDFSRRGQALMRSIEALGKPVIAMVNGFGGTQRLLRLGGRSTALELCLLGAPVDAARALALNLVNRVVPAAELEAETMALARQLSAAAPQAVRGVLDTVLLGAEAPLDVALDYETQCFALAFSTADMKEGTGAFLERRKPQFRGD